MARGSHRLREHRWTRLRAALSAVVFCVGVMVLPPLVVANLSVWLGCRHIDRQGCVELFSRSMLLRSMTAVGITDQVPPGLRRTRRAM